MKNSLNLLFCEFSFITIELIESFPEKFSIVIQNWPKIDHASG